MRAAPSSTSRMLRPNPTANPNLTPHPNPNPDPNPNPNTHHTVRRTVRPSSVAKKHKPSSLWQEDDTVGEDQGRLPREITRELEDGIVQACVISKEGYGAIAINCRLFIFSRTQDQQWGIWHVVVLPQIEGQALLVGLHYDNRDETVYVCASFALGSVTWIAATPDDYRAIPASLSLDPDDAVVSIATSSQVSALGTRTGRIHTLTRRSAREITIDILPNPYSNPDPNASTGLVQLLSYATSMWPINLPLPMTLPFGSAPPPAPPVEEILYLSLIRDKFEGVTMLVVTLSNLACWHLTSSSHHCFYSHPLRTHIQSRIANATPESARIMDVQLVSTLPKSVIFALLTLSLTPNPNSDKQLHIHILECVCGEATSTPVSCLATFSVGTGADLVSRSKTPCTFIEPLSLRAEYFSQSSFQAFVNLSVSQDLGLGLANHLAILKAVVPLHSVDRDSGHIFDLPTIFHPTPLLTTDLLAAQVLGKDLFLVTKNGQVQSCYSTSQKPSLPLLHTPRTPVPTAVVTTQSSLRDVSSRSAENVDSDQFTDIVNALTQRRYTEVEDSLRKAIDSCNESELHKLVATVSAEIINKSSMGQRWTKADGAEFTHRSLGLKTATHASFVSICCNLDLYFGEYRRVLRDHAEMLAAATGLYEQVSQVDEYDLPQVLSTAYRATLDEAFNLSRDKVRAKAMTDEDAFFSYPSQVYRGLANICMKFEERHSNYADGHSLMEASLKLVRVFKAAIDMALERRAELNQYDRAEGCEDDAFLANDSVEGGRSAFLSLFEMMNKVAIKIAASGADALLSLSPLTRDMSMCLSELADGYLQTYANQSLTNTGYVTAERMHEEFKVAFDTAKDRCISVLELFRDLESVEKLSVTYLHFRGIMLAVTKHLVNIDEGKKAKGLVLLREQLVRLRDVSGTQPLVFPMYAFEFLEKNLLQFAILEAGTVVRDRLEDFITGRPSLGWLYHLEKKNYFSAGNEALTAADSHNNPSQCRLLSSISLLCAQMHKLRPNTHMETHTHVNEAETIPRLSLERQARNQLDVLTAQEHLERMQQIQHTSVKTRLQPLQIVEEILQHLRNTLGHTNTHTRMLMDVDADDDSELNPEDMLWNCIKMLCVWCETDDDCRQNICQAQTSEQLTGDWQLLPRHILEFTIKIWQMALEFDWPVWKTVLDYGIQQNAHIREARLKTTVFGKLFQYTDASDVKSACVGWALQWDPEWEREHTQVAPPHLSDEMRELLYAELDRLTHALTDQTLSTK